jgi:RHH-type rel operon transcriptional repressor/antitoxin RelB
MALLDSRRGGLIRYTRLSEVIMAVEIPAEIESQIEAFASKTGESKDELVREALLTYLEDREDAMVAAERLKHASERISLDEIGRKYGLID